MVEYAGGNPQPVRKPVCGSHDGASGRVVAFSEVEPGGFCFELASPLSSTGPSNVQLRRCIMRKLIRLLGILLSMAVFIPSAPARKTERPPLPAKIMQATSVYLDCVCPRGLAVARDTALQQLEGWGRFQISQQRRQTDLVLLFSGNPYLGDYITRDGPDKRPVAVDFTIMTVIDPTTGQSLWTDSRRWGSLRVRGATKDLIEELRQQMEDQTKRWSLTDILTCSVTPVYVGFAHLSPAEALAKSDAGTAKVSGTTDHLILSSPDAPPFCKRAEFVFSPERRIIGFRVFASRADDLDVGEVLQQADRFDFAGGKYASGDQVYFNAQSKDQKILIQFNVDGHRSILSLVSYFY
jgi:hypothetical protein